MQQYFTHVEKNTTMVSKKIHCNVLLPFMLYNFSSNISYFINKF
jgi:hypothetical protein